MFIVFFKKKSVKKTESVKTPEIKAVAPTSVNKQNLSPEDMATEFLLSGLSENLQKLIKHAQKTGTVSRIMVEQACEMDGLSAEEAEDALIRISEIGVNVKEEYDEGEELSIGDDEDEKSHSYSDDEEDEDEDSDKYTQRPESPAAMQEFLSTHQEDDEIKFTESRSSDPVRNYLRAMGSIELFSRAGEIAIAKRIEAGRKLMIEGLCDSPMTVKKILNWYNSLLKEEMQLRDIVNLDLMYGDVFMDKDFSEEDLEAENEDDDTDTDIDDLDDENLDESELYEDSSQVPITAMEESLRPTVVETFENIKKVYNKLSKLEEKQSKSQTKTSLSTFKEKHS